MKLFSTLSNVFSGVVLVVVILIVFKENLLNLTNVRLTYQGCYDENISKLNKRYIRYF